MYVKRQYINTVIPAHISIWRMRKERTGQYTWDTQPDKRHKVVLGPGTTPGYKEINIKHIVEKWKHDHGHNNYGLRIEARSVASPGEFVVINPGSDDEEQLVSINGSVST